jgi:hypothetical protein
MLHLMLLDEAANIAPDILPDTAVVCTGERPVVLSTKPTCKGPWSGGCEDWYKTGIKITLPLPLPIR